METIGNILWHRPNSIVFSDFEVRRILAGKKTQFRKPVCVPKALQYLGCKLETASINRDDPSSECVRFHNSVDKREKSRYWNAVDHYCLFGRTGEHLWIKEPYQEDLEGNITYLADLDEDILKDDVGLWEGWKQGESMPISKSRGTIEITKVRLQRLNAMTEKEAQAEGVELFEPSLTHLQVFIKQWNKIRRDYYKFENCPLVWVLEFESRMSLQGSLERVNTEVIGEMVEV